MRIRHTLAAALMGATMLWTAAPALAASQSSTTPPVAQSQAPAAQHPTSVAPQSQVPASKSPVMSAKEEARPGLPAVIKELEQARTALQKDTGSDAAGHRAKTLQSIDQALRELHLASQLPTK